MADNTEFGTDTKKVWRGVKEDPKSGKYILYITETTQRAFNSIDEAVNFMTRDVNKSSSLSNNLTVEAKSNNEGGVQRGQENLEGLKQVEIVRRLVQDKASGDWVVKEKVRSNLIKDDSQDVKRDYKKLDQKSVREEVTEKQDIFDTDLGDETTLKTDLEKYDRQQQEKKQSKTSSLKPLGACAHCGASIYPPCSAEYAMDYWLDRDIPADTYCPCCGYGLWGKDNFKFNKNEQSVDNLMLDYGDSKSVPVQVLKPTTADLKYGYFNKEEAKEFVKRNLDWTANEIEDFLIKYYTKNYTEDDFKAITDMTKEDWDSGKKWELQ